MIVQLKTKNFIDYFKKTMKIIACQKDYITELDAATGDGDHWVNINKGFEKIVSMSDELSDLSISDMFKKVGTTILSAVGGSSGALYGSGYIAASRACLGKEYIDSIALYEVYNAILQEMMKRGKTKPGQKTMVDTLSVALEKYKKALDLKKDEIYCIQELISGAKEGAESTKTMEAVKGRASYRLDKGIGFLDPGAVTMEIQLESLGNYILDLQKRG